MVTQRNTRSHAREQKLAHADLQIKSIDANGRFAGYASVFDIVDNQRDIMLPGAFLNTLTKRAGNIKLLWQHIQSEPIGMIESLFEDARGLYIEGKLLLDVARAKEALSLLKAGAVKGLSIGYSPKQYSIDPDTGVRRLSEVDLWEVSLVTFPANEAAGVTVVKHDEARWNEAIQIGDAVALHAALDRAIGALIT